MKRSVPLALLSAAMLATSAPAQFPGTHNEAVPMTIVDPAALGGIRRLSLMWAAADLDQIGVGSFGMGPGALRIIVRGESNRFGGGIGYGALLMQHDAGGFGTISLGADGTIGYLSTTSLGTRFWSSAARAAIPIGLRWGSPNRVSLTPYVQPFAEIGSAPSLRYDTNCRDGSPDCFLVFRRIYLGQQQTHLYGLGVGFRLTLWRLGVDGGISDLPSEYRLDRGHNPFTLGLSWRF